MKLLSFFRLELSNVSGSLAFTLQAGFLCWRSSFIISMMALVSVAVVSASSDDWQNSSGASSRRSGVQELDQGAEWFWEFQSIGLQGPKWMQRDTSWGAWWSRSKLELVILSRPSGWSEQDGAAETIQAGMVGEAEKQSNGVMEWQDRRCRGRRLGFNVCVAPSLWSSSAFYFKGKWHGVEQSGTEDGVVWTSGIRLAYLMQLQAEANYKWELVYIRR